MLLYARKYSPNVRVSRAAIARAPIIPVIWVPDYLKYKDVSLLWKIILMQMSMLN